MIRSLIVAAAAVHAGSANADITFPIQQAQIDSGQFVTADVTVTPLGSGRYNVSIRSNVNEPAIVVLDTDGTADVINKITIEEGCCSNDIVDLYIEDFATEGTSAIAGIEKISIDDPQSTKLVIKNLDISGSLGTSASSDNIEASFIENLMIGGDLFGKIVIENNYDSLPNTGNWIMILGDLKGGSILHLDGSVNHISIGDDGNESDSYPFGGNTPQISVEDEVDTISLWGDYEGVVGATGQSFIGPPDVRWLGVLEDFTGSAPLAMAGLDRLGVGNDFDAELDVADVLPEIEYYHFGGSLVSGSAIDLPSDGLEGQVIINKTGGVANDWLGDIAVGLETLAPNYTVLSSELGGGQVGIAPFNFHQRTSAPTGNAQRDCDPYHTEPVFVGPSYRDLPEVRIRHYGPVYVDTTAEEHAYTVEFKSDVLPSSWVDRTSLFMIDDSRTATETNMIAPHRDVYLIPDGSKGNTGFEAAGRWRIRPNDSDLMDTTIGPVKCADVDGNPDVEYSSWYTFRVFLEAPSGGTLLEDGTTAFELTEWGIAPYEVNADGETDAQDFTDLANSYSSQ